MNSTASLPSEGCISDEEISAYLYADPSDPSIEPVRRHVERCSQCRILLAEAARDISEDSSTSRPRAALRTLGDDEVVGSRYVIEHFVARGGMGEVYSARDLHLNESVALKTLICTILDDSDAVDRFKAEVQTARKISHPNVCRIMEFGLHRRNVANAQESLPFLTMEFLQGQTLRQIVQDSGPLASDRAMLLAMQLLDGLEAVHLAGTVHRDLKTDNVFVVPQKQATADRVVITDFGLAKPTTLDQVRSFSDASNLAGTTAYMAPEQLRGKPASTQSDVYSLGVVLYEMATGQLPFLEETAIATALKKLDAAAPDPRAINKHINPRLRAAIIGCLQPEPSQRLSSPADVRQALTTGTRFRNKKKPLWATAASLLVIGAVAFWAAADIDNPNKHKAQVAPPTSGDDEAAVAFWSANGVDPPNKQQPDNAPPSVATSPTTKTASEPEQPETVAAEPEERAVVVSPPTAPAASLSASKPLKIRRRPAKRKTPVRSAPAAAATPASEPEPQAPTAIETLLKQAHTLINGGKARAACTLLEDAQAQHRSAPGLYKGLGKCYMRSGRSVAARKAYRKYLELAPDAPDRIFIESIIGGK